MSATQERKLRQAAAALAAGDHAAAERLCREVLERAPHYPRALHLAAVARLGQGDAAEARALLSRVLEGDPRNPQVMEDLGAAELNAGDPVQAESLLRRAIGLGRDGAAVWCWLALSLSTQGRHVEAIEAFRKAAAAEPGNEGMHLNLGNELMQAGEWEKAVASYEQAIRLRPDFPEALNGLGTAHQARARQHEAVERFQRAIALQPDYADAHSNLGEAYFQLGETVEAEACLRRAVALQPDIADFHADLGNILLEQQRWDDAIAEFRHAIALRPDHVEAHDRLGNAFLQLGRDQEADSCFRSAILLQPDEADRYSRFGDALAARHEWDEAIAQFGRALKLDPAYAYAQFGLARVRLFRGEFEQAWPGYERRLDTTEFRKKNFRDDAASLALYERLPHWRGPGETGVSDVAIWAEQGIGDQVLFSTLIPELVETGVPFLYEVDRRLAGAYQRSFPGVRFVAKGEPPQDVLQRANRVLSVGSLPQWFRHSRADFARQPLKLLSALPGRVAHYRERIGAQGPGLKVALSWRSTRKDWWGPKKTAPLSDFTPLLKLPGVRFVDVQYGDTEAERRGVEMAGGGRLLHFDEVDYYNDLEEVLAILEACDLLITTSNATAHFAGALGKRTWLLYQSDQPPFHYWAHHGSHRAPWYPSVEIITAPHLATWNSLAEYVARKLEEELAQPVTGTRTVGGGP